MHPQKNNTKRIVIAISGASGAIYGIRLLEVLRQLDAETHLIISRSAKITIAHETDYSIDQVIDLASYHYNYQDIGCSLSSGSFKVDGMIVAPCSMKSLGLIAASIEDNLIARSASVMLKERRRLVLMIRETPLHTGHLENMLKLSQYGAIIAPPVPALYNRPSTIDDIVNHSITRVLDLFDIDTGLVKRWKGVGGG